MRRCGAFLLPVALRCMMLLFIFCCALNRAPALAQDAPRSTQNKDLAHNKSPLRIGVIGGFSGAGRNFGEAVRNGLEMARSEIGLSALQIIYEDTQFHLPATIAAFRKLVHYDLIDLVIVLGASPAATIAPLAEQEQVIMIAWGNAEEISRKKRWVIRNWITGAAEGAAIIDRLIARAPHRVGILWYSDEYANSFVRGVESALHVRSPAVQVISLGELLPLESDLRAYALKAKAKEVDAVVMCPYLGQAANFALNLRALKSDSSLFGCEGLNNDEEQRAARGALKGAVYSTIPVSDSFRARYVKMWNAHSIIAGAAVHYELYRLLHELYQPGLSREQLLERILAVRSRRSVVGTFDVRREGDDQSFHFDVVTEVVP